MSFKLIKNFNVLNLKIDCLRIVITVIFNIMQFKMLRIDKFDISIFLNEIRYGFDMHFT